MKVTRSDFARALFYAGSGTDIQVLLRFSHLVDTFVFACVGDEINEATVERSFRDKLSMINRIYPGALDLSATSQHLDLDDFESETPADGKNFLSSQEFSEYCSVFERFRKQKNWAAEFLFHRRVASTRRPIRVIFLHGEAMASYCALSHNGKNAPRIFCGIQTGMLDLAEGVMNRVFDSHAQTPEYWVRGAWRHDDALDHGLSDVICSKGGFNKFAQSYRSWNSRMGTSVIPRGWGYENPVGEFSAVAAFSRVPLGLKNRVVLRGQSRCVNVFNRRLTKDDARKFSAVFAPKHVIEKNPNIFSGRTIVETDRRERLCLPREHKIGPTALLSEVLEGIDNYAAKHCAPELALVATGFEDEGICLEEWLKRDGPSCCLSVFAPEPLDFADLRGLSPRRSILARN